MNGRDFLNRLGVNPQEQPQEITSSQLAKIRQQYAQEVYDRRYQNKDGKPKDSFGKDLFENWQAGVGQIALMPYRAVETLENFGMDIENAVRGTNFQHGQGTATRFMNSVMGGDYLRSRVRHYQKESDRYQDNKGIIESGLEGDLGTAVGKAILGTVQSAPNLLVSIYSGKKGLEVFGGALLGTTAALQKYDEIHDREDLSTADKALDMFGAFVAECVPEIIGAKRFGKMFNHQKVGAVRREVQQEVMTGWGKFLNSRFVQGSGKTFDWLMKYFGEGLTEGMTDVMNLAIDRALGVKNEITKSDLLGIGDSFIIGQLSDAGPSAVHAYQRHDYNSRVREEIENNPDLSLVAVRQQVDAQAIADIATKAAFGDALTEKERKVFDAYKDEIGKQTAIRYGINNVCAAAGVSEDPNKHAIFISAIAQSGKTQEEVKKILSKEYEDRTEAEQRYLDEELPALMREQQRISTAIDNGEPVVAYNSPLFGNVYQWMRGKNAEAVAFLEKQGNGYLKGVFHRDGLGDVDILWGSDRAGLNNIIDNHVRTNDDFDSAEEAMDIIDQVITYGSIREENGHIVAELAPFRVSLTESRDGTLVVTAFENKHNEETPQVETPAAPESEQPTVEQPTAQPETQADELRQRAAAEAQKEINEIAHQDGNVYRVGIRGLKGVEGYAKFGDLNLQTNQDGTFSTRGTQIVTIKMTDGSVKQPRADEVVILEAPASAQDRLQAITDHLYARYANNEVFHIGDKVTIKQNGQTSGDTSTITNITDDGVEVEIIDPNGQPNTTVIPHEEAAEKLAVVPGETEQGIISINIPEMGELRLRDLGNGQYQTLAPDREGNYQTFTEDQIAEYMEQPAQETVETPEPTPQAVETPEPTPQAVEATPQAAPQVSMPQASMPTVQMPQAQQATDAAALRANMTAEDYGRTVVEQLEGDKDMAGRMVAAQLKQAQAALAELQKQSVTEPEDSNDLNAWKQYKAQKNALLQQIKVVQADVEKLTAAQQAVADYKSPAELQAEQEAAAQAEQEAAIEARKQLNEQMRQRAAEFADKLGVTIVPFESTDELPESQQKVKDAMAALDKNKAVAAWYDDKTRSVFLNLQKITDLDDLVAKIFHEAVAHLGLKEMMNRIDKGVGFKKLLRGTWSSMSEESKEKYAAYVYASRPSMRQGMSSIRYENLTSDEKAAIRNRDDVQLAAADEYIANLAEKRAKLEASDKSESANAIRKAWVEFVQFFRDLYVSLTGADLTVTDEDLAKLIHFSYTELKKRAAEQRTPEEALSIAEAETDTNPTEAQKKAENYKQGHVTLWELPITIENPKGSIRRGTDANGKQWEQEMHHTYGKIRRTEGVDGDHIDVFIGPNLTSDKVFVVDQRNVDTGEFDEHKVMLGFDSLEEAQNGYLSNYEEGWQGMGTVTEVTMDEFKKWIDSSHRKTKPFAEYKSVKAEGAAATAMEEQQAPTDNRETSETPAEGEQVQETEEPQPIGQGLFGYIYDQFRGKVKEAFDFLMQHKSGDLLGVFHDDALGDIDLVWGNKKKNAGLEHIIDKHVGEGKDFATIDEARQAIENIIKNGKKIKNNADKVIYELEGKRVVVRKNLRDTATGEMIDDNKKWVVTSYDNNVPKSKKKSSTSTLTTPESNEGGRAVTSDENLSGDKGTTNNSDTQENEQENAKNLQNLSVLQDLVEKNDQNNTPQDYLRTLPDEQLDALEDILDPMRYEESDQGKLADEMHTFVVKEQARRYDMELEERRIAARKPAESEQLKRFYELHDGLRRSLMSKDGKYNEWIHEISDYLHSLAASKLRDIYQEAVRLNGVENVPGNLRDAYEHVHSVLEEMQNFDEVLAQQGDLSGTPSKPKINIRDWVADKTQVQEMLQGVYNDPSGVGVASNGHILIATPSLYDQSKSGTVVKPNGTVVDADYVKWQPVVDSARRGNQNTASVDWEAIRSFIAGIKDKMKADGHPWNKKYLDKIVFRMPDGKVIGFRLTNFIPFADAAALIGSPVLHYSGMNGMFHVENGNSVALIMPVINMTETGVDNYFYDLSNGQPMFSLVDEDENNKSLVGLHNISEEKLRKALKMGGLANPSTAVINIATQNHEQYGDISLIMPSSLVDSKTGRNAGTFTGDIWSPTYPSVERIMSDKGDEAYYQAITKAFGNNEARRPVLSRAKLDFDDYLDSGNVRAGLAYWYLLEKGIEPGDVYFNSGISDDIKRRFEPLMEHGLMNMTAEERSTLLSLIAEREGKTADDLLQEAQTAKKRYEDTIADPNAKPFYKTIAQRTIEEIDTYGVRYKVLSDGYYAIERAVRDDGKIDLTSTLIAAQDIVQTQHQADFDKWISDFDERFDISEVLFQDYDRDGNRKYKPHTLANVSRMMNKEDLQNAGDHGGLGATRGILVKRLETLADIRAEKGRLRPGTEEDIETEEWNKMQDEWFNKVLNPLSDMQKISDNPFSNVGYAETRLQEALRTKDPIATLNKEYGYKIDPNGEWAKNLKDLVQRIKSLPTKYFETKFRRPVYLNEFANAVVPNDLPQDLRDGLEKAGLTLFEYDPNVEGSRRVATLQATEDDGVRFALVDEEDHQQEMDEIKAKAQADGTFMQAPNEQPTNLNERQWLQVRTRAFKRWFGDWENDPENASKVLDENGEPMVAKHGTPYSFTTFDENKQQQHDAGWLGRGFYFFTKNDDYAADYARGGRVLNTFLNIREPYFATYKDMERLAELEDKEESARFTQQLIDDGYDGVYFDGNLNGEYVAFSPNQIKSATDNNGEFSEENDDIRFALVDEDENAAPERDYNRESLIDYAKRMQAWHKEQKAVNERVSQAEASTEGDLFTASEQATQNDDHVLYSLVDEEGVEEVPTPTEVIEAFMSLNSARNDMRSVKFRNQRIGNMRALREQLERLRAAWEREITNAETTGNEQGRIVGEIEQGIRDRQLALKEEYQKSARMITDFAKAMFRGKVIQNMTDADFSRLMTEIRDASTKFDLQRSYDALTEVLNRVQSRYLQLSQETLNKAATIPTTKRNATGVDEGRRVDPIHHQMLTTFNELRNTDVPYVERKLTEWEDAITSETSDTELGLLSAKIAAANIAKNYLEQRKQIEEASTELGLEIKTLGQEIHDMWEDGSRGAERKEKLALRMTKMHEMFELRDKYIVLNDETAYKLGELTAEGHTQYIEDIKAKAEHKREVLRGMSRDLRGIPDNAAALDEDKGGLGDKYLSPLRTFTHELRKFGTHSAGGEGYLYHHFAPLVHDARSNYLEHVRERMNMLDSKAQELFGEGVTWKDVINKVSNKVTEVEATWNMPEGADTEVDSAGIPKKKKAEPRFLTQGQIMYIYMVNKMSDGKLKLRDMNISEAQVEYLRQQLPTELVQLADWLQDEYFPTTRKRYNETNIFLYGTPMAEILHYVPLRISGDSRTPNVDIQQGDKQLLPSNVTGSAISRTFNKLPIDLKTDAMQLVLDNMEEMEHWSAYAELITDLNTLLNSTSFKNRIEKMNPNNYANFFKTAQLAVEQYRPKQGFADALVTGLTRFIATSKISLRLWTALKQTLSFVSPLSEGGEFNKEYMHAIAHSKESFQWALENLPIFRERWEGRQGGNEKLNIAEITTNGGKMSDLLDWAQENLVKYGIKPNAFVDAVVCANMAKAQYEVKKRYYEERGYSPEAVERLAKWKADEIYNETQQSSEGAFISPMQRDRTFISSVISLFNNSSMAYNRKNAEALREAYKIAKRDKQEFVNFRTEQLIKDGVAPEQAAVFAEQDYNRARKHAIADIAINGFVIQYVWNRGGKLFKTWMMLAPMFFFGDDDDREKAWDEFTSELKKDMVVSGVQPIRGLPFGATLESAASEAYDWFVDDTKRKYMNRYEVAGKIASNIHPAIQDASTIISSLTKKEVDALGLASLIVNMSASSLTSIDTQTLASMLWAAEDFIEKTGRWTWNDFREDMAIFLNVPPSQIEKMVLAPRRDETPYEYAQRYTTYQKLRRYGVFVPFADTPDLTKTQKKKLNEEWNK